MLQSKITAFAKPKAITNDGQNAMTTIEMESDHESGPSKLQPPQPLEEASQDDGNGETDDFGHTVGNHAPITSTKSKKTAEKETQTTTLKSAELQKPKSKDPE
jgi:hypothetical protein